MAVKLLLVIYSIVGPIEEFTKAFDQAEEYKIWTNFSPTQHAEIANAYAWQLFKSGTNLGKALKAATEATKIKPKSAWILDTLGCILQAIGKDSNAINVFEQALQFRKDDKCISWDILAALYSRLGKTKEAAAALRKVPKDGKREKPA